MATLTLTKVWINLWATGAALSAYSKDRARAQGISGRVATYGGGRQRSITRKGVRTEFSVTLQDVTEAGIATLTGWAGSAVQVRDHRGQMFVGIYTDLKIAERLQENTLYEVALTLAAVTVAESV